MVYLKMLLKGLDGDDDTLDLDHTDACANGYLVRGGGYSLPDVATNGYTAIAASLDGFADTPLLTYHGIDIAHTVIVGLVQIAKGEGAHHKDANGGDNHEDSQLDVDI